MSVAASAGPGEMEVIIPEQEKQPGHTDSPGGATGGVPHADALIDSAVEARFEDKEPIVSGVWASERIAKDHLTFDMPGKELIAGRDLYYDDKMFYDEERGHDYPRQWGETLAQFVERVARVGGHVGTASGPQETFDERRRSVYRAREESQNDDDSEEHPFGDPEDKEYRWVPESELSGSDEQSGWEPELSGHDAKQNRQVVAEMTSTQREEWSVAAEEQRFGTKARPGSDMPDPAYSVEDLFREELADAISEIADSVNALVDNWEPEMSKQCWPADPDKAWFADQLATRYQIKRLLEEGGTPSIREIAFEMVQAGKQRATWKRGVRTSHRFVPELDDHNVDAFAVLDAETQADLLERGHAIAERWDDTWTEVSAYESEPSPKHIAHLLAARMSDGESPALVAYRVSSTLQRRADDQLICGHARWKAWEKYSTTISGKAKVVTLFANPAHNRQAQAGILRDEHGREAKFAVWKGHDFANPQDWRHCQVGVSPAKCNHVSQGDVVVFEDFAVRTYNGQTILESTRRGGAESELHVVDSAENQAVHTGYPDVEGQVEPPSDTFDGELELPEDTPEKIVPTGEAVRTREFVESVGALEAMRYRVDGDRFKDLAYKRGFNQCTNWHYPRSACPEWFIEKHEGQDDDTVGV